MSDLNFLGKVSVLFLIMSVVTGIIGLGMLLVWYLKKPRSRKLFIASQIILTPTYISIIGICILLVHIGWRYSNRYEVNESEFVGTYMLKEAVENEFGEQHILIKLSPNHQYTIESDVLWLIASKGTWTFNDNEDVISFNPEKEYMILVERNEYYFNLALKQAGQDNKERIYLERIFTESEL